MEEVERGVGGTGRKTRVGARGRSITGAMLAHGSGNGSKKIPPALLPEGSLGRKTTDGRGLTAPVCERDGDARPHHANRALSAVQIRSRAQGIAGRTAAPPARREGGTPTDMAGKETPPVGLPQANIQAAPRTRMELESGSPITATTSYCADHSTGARNVEPVT